MSRERIEIEERRCRWCGKYIARVPLQDLDERQAHYVGRGWYWTWIHRETRNPNCPSYKLAEPEDNQR